MTQSIDLAHVRTASLNTEEQGEAVRHRRALTAVKVLSVLAAAGSLVCLGGCLMSEEFSLHFIAGSATLAVLSSIGGSLLVLHALLTSRQDYYQRGVVDGWMRGWRGLPPEVDDAPGFQ